MKKTTLLIFLLFWPLFSPAPAKAWDFQKPAKPNQAANTFKDPALNQPTREFSPGQTIYFYLETEGSGDQEKNLRLLDSEKREVQKIDLDRSGPGPFIFKASFPAPQTPGLYYLDLKIKSAGFSLTSQTNLTVGDHQSSSVSSEVKSVVVVNGETVIAPSETTPTAFPSVTPKPIPEKLEKKESTSFFTGFFEKLWQHLLSFFKSF
jgi:hypothetical protein